MWHDPIVDEVRKARREYAAKFNFDLDAIFRDLKEQQNTSGRTYVSYPPKRPVPTEKVKTGGPMRST